MDTFTVHIEQLQFDEILSNVRFYGDVRIYAFRTQDFYSVEKKIKLLTYFDQMPAIMGIGESGV